MGTIHPQQNGLRIGVRSESAVISYQEFLDLALIGVDVIVGGAATYLPYSMSCHWRQPL
jgi:hypothetical protein